MRRRGSGLRTRGRATPLPKARPCSFPIWRLRGTTWRMRFVLGEPQDRFGSSCGRVALLRDRWRTCGGGRAGARPSRTQPRDFTSEQFRREGRNLSRPRSFYNSTHLHGKNRRILERVAKRDDFCRKDHKGRKGFVCVLWTHNIDYRGDNVPADYDSGHRSDFITH